MRKVITVAVTSFIVVFLLSACTDEAQKQDKSRRDAVASREDVFDRAEAVHPVPTNLSNFPMREVLAKMTLRQDEVNHPWYIYIMGMNGEPIGYYVGQTYPVNACNFLSDSTRFVDLPDGQWGVTTAPSYDGVFYGGGGAASNCNGYVFFDVTTNAMHTFVAPMWVASDRPMNLDVPRLGTEGEIEEVEPAPITEPTPEDDE
jgi:hypothetical protein